MEQKAILLSTVSYEYTRNTVIVTFTNNITNESRKKEYRTRRGAYIAASRFQNKARADFSNGRYNDGIQDACRRA